MVVGGWFSFGSLVSAAGCCVGDTSRMVLRAPGPFPVCKLATYNYHTYISARDAVYNVSTNVVWMDTLNRRLANFPRNKGRGGGEKEGG